ncbi:MAG: TlpA family protein disulfide reductase [Candidatus Dormibacteria bacterium]
MLFLSGCSLQQQLTGSSQNLATVGQSAPAWVGTDLDGKTISLSDFKGHPVLLNFWASWCGPCRAEQPGLDQIAKDFAPKGLRVIGVDIRDNLDQAKIYRDEFKMPYPSVFDQAAHLAYAYRVDFPPSSVFIDSNGVIAFKVAGGLGAENYRRIIEDKLIKPA